VEEKRSQIEWRTEKTWKGTTIVARKLARGRVKSCEGNREAGKERWNESSELTTSSHFFTDVDGILSSPHIDVISGSLVINIIG